MSVAHLLVGGAAHASGGAAVVSGDRVITYPRLVERVSRLAAGLHRLGLRRGDRVVLLMPNSPGLLEALWACFWGGFVAVPLNWHLHPDEVAYVVGHCDAAAIVVAPETRAIAGALPDGIQILDAAIGGRSGIPPVAVDGDDPAWLFYTSGTTGKPKGATLTHRNLLAMTTAYYADLDPVAPGSTYLHAAPLTHGSGLYLLPAIGHGAVNVIAAGPRFSAAGYLELVAAHRVTHAAFLAPTMLKRVVAAAAADGPDLSSLRSVVVGGAPFYQEDLRAAVDVLGPVITQIYGQGEAPMTITIMPADAAARHPGSCGRPFAGVEVLVADPGGEARPEGADGQVLVRGDVVMSGYWNAEQATAAALVDGWLRTGDIGHFADGYLYLTDRAKDVIITGGSNVYPREVEEVLLACPGVQEVAVIGVPDPEWGESVRAFVVADAPLEADQVIDFCRTRMASFKKPRDVVFVAELPKNATGKVLKRDLRSYRA